MNKLASSRIAARLTDPDLVLALSQFVRARVPPDEVDDIVQATLVRALASPHAPEVDDEGEEHAKTLEWMLREGEGEKLEATAVGADVPAPRVRHRFPLDVRRRRFR